MIVNINSGAASIVFLANKDHARQAMVWKVIRVSADRLSNLIGGRLEITLPLSTVRLFIAEKRGDFIVREYEDLPI